MANELLAMPNPDDWPRGGETGVVGGYQRQNTNLFVLNTGLDTTEPFEDGGMIRIPAGGIVEVNGILYRIPESVSLPNLAGNAAWLAVTPDGFGGASLEQVARPGRWMPDKKGCYLEDGRRTLNWVSAGTLANPPASGWVYRRDTKLSRGVVSLQKGWYYAQLRSGAGGGDAAGTAGGITGERNAAEMIFFASKPFYELKVGGSGLNGSNGAASRGGTPGGGGGGGSGEESVFDGFSTGMVPPGNGADGAAAGTTNHGPGGRGGRNGSNGSRGGWAWWISSGGTGGLYFGGGGGGGGGSGTEGESEFPGGNGGNGGDGGQSQPDDYPGGSCTIWALGG